MKISEIIDLWKENNYYIIHLPETKRDQFRLRTTYARVL